MISWERRINDPAMSWQVMEMGWICDGPDARHE